MLRWKIEPLTLDLKYTWKISRNSSDQKKNLIVTLDDGTYSGKGEAAPNVRYNESAEEGIKLFARFINSVPEQITRPDILRELSKSANIFNSLSFAIECEWFRYE